MKRTLLSAVAMASFISARAFAADLPSRYAPPPVVGGGPGTKVGVLHCTLGAHLGLIIGGFERMACRFTPEGPGPAEAYSGTMATLGVDLGFTAGGALTWGVYAPTNYMMPGSLAGSYVGASGNVGFAVGVGENFLIGGSANTVALQPWSVEGTAGVNVSVGLANMELRPAM
jgi:hypothetical protein